MGRQSQDPLNSEVFISSQISACLEVGHRVPERILPRGIYRDIVIKAKSKVEADPRVYTVSYIRVDAS